MEVLISFWKWIQARFAERSTWDGTVILAISILMFVTGPLIKYVAVAGVVYGLWRMIQKEQGSDLGTE